MRSSSAGMIAARANPNLVSRDLYRIAGRDYSSGAVSFVNFWNDLDVVNFPIVDIDTGLTTTYSFTGSGPILSTGDISFVCEQSITVSTQQVMLSQLNQAVINQIRGYDLHEQPLYIYQADFDPVTRQLAAPAECVFAGYVDTVEITDPDLEKPGQIELQVRSHVTEMTRTNALTRSHASEILRNSGDNFYKDTAVVGDWIEYWGQNVPKPAKASTTQTLTEYLTLKFIK